MRIVLGMSANPGDGFGGALAIRQSCPKRGVLNTVRAGEFRYGEHATVTFKSAGVASVRDLLDGGRPAAIARRVGAIAVREAVDRMTGRARPHIAQECFETSGPFWTHRNPAATVVGEVDRAGIGASRFRVRPRTVFARPYVADRGSMGVVTSSDFVVQAAAAFLATTPQICAGDENRATTVTQAGPVPSMSSSMRSELDDESVKALSGDINKSSHRRLLPSAVGSGEGATGAETPPRPFILPRL